MANKRNCVIFVVTLGLILSAPLKSEAGRYNENVVQGNIFKKYLNTDYIKKSAQESKDITEFLKKIYNPELLLDLKDAKSFRLGRQTFFTVDDYNTSSLIKENITDKASYNMYCQEKGGTVYLWDEIGGATLVKGYVCEKDGLPESIQIRYSELPDRHSNVYAHRYAYGTSEMFINLANQFNYFKSGNGQMWLESLGGGRFSIRVQVTNKGNKPAELSFARPIMIVGNTEYAVDAWRGAEKTIMLNPGVKYDSGVQRISVQGFSFVEGIPMHFVFGSFTFDSFTKSHAYERDKRKWSPQIDDLPKSVLK